MTAIALGVGVALRAWYAFHWPITADESIVGLMSRQILQGHFSAFYWGQVYGGAEPYPVAVLAAITRSTVWALKLTPILLSAGAAVLTWRIARRLVPDARLAALAGALVWAAPQSAVVNSTVEMGFRGVTLVCGLGLVLVALRLFDGRRSWRAFGGLGLLAGVGWWSSPEIVYFAVPAVVLVGVAIHGDPELGHLRRWGTRLALTVVAAVVGALPWLWANVVSGWHSLTIGAFQVPPDAPGYSGRLRLFFEYMLPMLFSLRAQQTGDWLVRRGVCLVLLALLSLALLGALVLSWLRDGRSRALAIGVIAFPFLMALSPATWFWGDGRYADLAVPLIVLVLVVGCAEVAGRLWHGRRGQSRKVSARRLAMATLGLVMVALTVANFAGYVAPGDSFFTGWTNPDAPTDRAIADLEADGVTAGYADYWVAYRLDLLGDGRLQITTAGSDVNRWSALNTVVDDARSPAWLFVTPAGQGPQQFGATVYIQGPDGLSQTAFVADLNRLGIGYRLVDAGLVRAVIPDRRVTPRQIFSFGSVES
ncbi:MAG TPA: glycosyltransferase family 39 protein [Acidimicrobiales bacterium]|nr:glycosyltransferase family 39 protein [Acidimicrobiales bacterium]